MHLDVDVLVAETRRQGNRQDGQQKNQIEMGIRPGATANPCHVFASSGHHLMAAALPKMV